VGEESPESSRIILGLFNAVEQDRAQSQRVLASELGIALGQVNAYLKGCIKKGLVKVRSAPAHRYLIISPRRGWPKSRAILFFGRPRRIAQQDVLLGAWRHKVDGAIRAMPFSHWLNPQWVRSLWDRVQKGARTESFVLARVVSILVWEQRL
jgi:winged helix-turn-helix DNA-binding protein